MLSGDSALDVESTFSADLQAPSLPGPISPHGSYCDKVERLMLVVIIMSYYTMVCSYHKSALVCAMQDDEQCSGAVRSDENNKGKKKR